MVGITMTELFSPALTAEIAAATPLPLPLEWCWEDAPVAYDDAISTMEARAKAIRAGTAGELIWLLEHPPVYTAGTSAKSEDLLEVGDALIRETGRGGEWTYHGPGQRVVYILLDVSRRGQDVRRFVREVEGWAIAALAELGITADRRQGYPGCGCRTRHQPALLQTRSPPLVCA